MKKIVGLVTFKILIILDILIILALISENASANTWSTETLDSAGYTGHWTSIDLDSNDYPHISYYDWTEYIDDLMYVRWTGSSWDIQTVDSEGDAGRFASLAVDTDNNSHISYHFSGSGDPVHYHDLRYAKWTGTDWSIQTVDYLGDVGYQCSIALDSSDYPHISYWDEDNHNIKYARWTGGGWNIGVVGHAGSFEFSDERSISIDLDSNDYAHIAYFEGDNKDLKYANWTGSGWNIVTVDSVGEVGHCVSIELDSSDYPHISYFDFTNWALKYAHWDGGGWNVETLDSSGEVGYATSIALNKDDFPYISYYDGKNNDLKLAWYNASGWQFEYADTAESVGGYTSIGIDSTENIHISYYDFTNSALKYARKYSIVPAAPTGLIAIPDDTQVSLS
ncbi:MAG: hypothetical protein JSV56_08225, partial [Methanomassiliicoccales archaeon]